jgi:glutamate-1-semialdehyde 2,1-aminomutase
MPGGVSSPVRSFKGLDICSPFIDSGSGAVISDLEGREYLDYVLSWGPLILGHTDPDVTAALSRQLQKGTSYGAPTVSEVLLAESVRDFFPFVEMLRFVNSGTEAVMTAVRLARAVTGRKYIIKFDGCYHGHADSFLVKAGSGVMTFGQADSPGVPEELAHFTLVADYNNTDSVTKLLESVKGQVAAILLEPVPGNMGLILPEPGFLESLREIADASGALLIFDEVMSGFRVAKGGACERFGVQPDLLCLGKVIGGGLPVGAFGGRSDLMSQLSPVGPVYQAGTLSGNPLAMAAGLACLKKLQQGDYYPQFEFYTDSLRSGLLKLAESEGIDITVNSCGSMFTVFFSSGPVGTKADVQNCNIELFRRFFRGILAAGIYWPSSQYEASFISVCHGRQELDFTLECFARVFADLKD